MPAKLDRLIAILQLLVWLAIAMLLVLPTLKWLEATGGTVAWLLALPPYLAVVLGLGELLRFCRAARHHGVFTKPATRALQRFGWSLIAGSALMPISRLVLAWWLGAGAVEAGRAFAPLGPAVLLAIALGAMFGLVLVVFAAILGEASRLAEENAGFV